MAADKFLVACDGQDRHALDFAISRARKEGAELYAVHVLEWSPYSFLTVEELAERHKTRQSELARADKAILQPILEAARAAGVTANGEVRHGNPVDTICEIAMEQGAVLIFVGRSNRLSERVFGSVASGLAQCSAVPVVIVP
jgi:nucleotide-binding universal stress UspA family protein